MQQSDTMDMAFREAFHAALQVSGVAAGCGQPLRDAYRAAFARDNPKHVLGLLAEIEAAIPPEPEPAP